MRNERVRNKLLDYYILFLSIVAFVGGIFMIGFCWFYLNIRDIKPYLLFGSLAFLGTWAYRTYRGEVEI